MRHNLPPIRIQKKLLKLLISFFRNENPNGYKLWLKEICAYYRIKTPKTIWVSSRELKKNAGLTYSDGRIHLMRPEVWCAMPEQYNRSMKEWLSVLNHEFYHVLNWIDDEAKADEFSAKMIKCLKDI